MDLPAEIRVTQSVRLQVGDRVFSHGQGCANYLVVTKGCVRVFARSAEGREVVLYRVRPGEMCILTTACLLGHTDYPAEAVAETVVEAHAMPLPVFERLLESSVTFRQFVFSSFSQRMADVMKQFAEIVFERTNDRLARFLLENRDESGNIRVTHASIGLEIGSSREVISRHLKAMERAGLLELGRGRIRILDASQLAEIIGVASAHKL